jgi:hypothetical protein
VARTQRHERLVNERDGVDAAQLGGDDCCCWHKRWRIVWVRVRVCVCDRIVCDCSRTYSTRSLASAGLASLPALATASNSAQSTAGATTSASRGVGLVVSWQQHVRRVCAVCMPYSPYCVCGVSLPPPPTQGGLVLASGDVAYVRAWDANTELVVQVRVVLKCGSCTRDVTRCAC